MKIEHISNLISENDQANLAINSYLNLDYETTVYSLHGLFVTKLDNIIIVYLKDIFNFKINFF